MNFTIKDLLEKEEEWCKYMGYENVYLDPFKYHITDGTVTTDGKAYQSFPQNRHVYDKLWIAKTQNMNCGRLEDLAGRENKIKYPIFIKPRWGHLSASSKNCYKIASASELRKYMNNKHMMWSEFIDGKEGMTDYLLLNGRIVYQITYEYSEKQHGFTDAWKYISPDNKAPAEITEWVSNNINGHTGFVNMQYRKNKIIEVSLRPARGGGYIIAADNFGIMRNIHNVIDKQYWDPSLEKSMDFKPYYAFKCYTQFPILYIWPQKVLDLIVKNHTEMPLFEYYFEPVNNEGCVFLQFMHYDFEKGMKAKKQIEWLFFLTQLFILVLFITVVYCIITFRSPMKYWLVVVFTIIYMTRLLNPMHANYNWYKAYRQLFVGNDSTLTPEEYENKIKNNDFKNLD